MREKIRGLATYYTNAVERMEIHVVKGKSQGLPATKDQRGSITLVVGERHYQAGLRSTVDCNFVWVSPDLTDADGNETKLAYVLPDAGFVKNQQVELGVSDRVVTLSTAGTYQNMSNQALQQTAAAILVSPENKAVRAATAAELVVS